MPSPLRPHPPRCPATTAVAALALAAALITSACGEPAAPTASPTGTPASEVNLARVGGVAGFQDVLAVAPDGRVTGTTRNGAVDCTVPATTVQVLATAPPPTTGLNAGNDRIAASVERDGTTIDLGEAAGSDPLSTAAREVLDDVQLPEDQRTVCR
jgi:hypothetical protein